MPDPHNSEQAPNPRQSDEGRIGLAMKEWRTDRAIARHVESMGGYPKRTDFPLRTRFRWTAEKMLCAFLTKRSHWWAGWVRDEKGMDGWTKRCRLCRCTQVTGGPDA